MDSVDANSFRDALLACPEIAGVTVTSDFPGLVIELDATTPSGPCQLMLRWDAMSHRLPRVFLRDPASVPPLPHINYVGQICYTVTEGVAVNPTQPVETVHDCVRDALATLADSTEVVQAGGLLTFYEEWEGYWVSLPDAKFADLHLSLNGPAREILAYAMSHGGRRRCVAFAETQRPHSAYGALANLRTLGPVPALYVPLEKPVPPPTKKNPLSATMVASWLKYASPENRQVAERFLRSVSRRVDEAYLLFSQPRTVGGDKAAFGLGFHGKSGRHPLLDSETKWPVSPIALQRHDRDYLTERGGAEPGFTADRVGVIGCGSVGSRVAELLALSGFGRLVLSDPEVFVANNLFRHVLPSDAIHLIKAYAMKVALERRLPGLEVMADVNQVSGWSPDRRALGLKGEVLAIGDAYLERKIVREFHAEAPAGTPLVTCWLEPRALGGHALLTVAGARGCLECLYTRADGTSLAAPKTGFVEPGQSFAKDLTGCGGAFTPYSAIDAAQLAAMATRMLVDHVAGRDPPKYMSWRGDPRGFHDAGYRTTAWFDAMTEAAAKRAATEFSQCPCPVCGGTRDQTP